jgi:hypothetical protein
MQVRWKTHYAGPGCPKDELGPAASPRLAAMGDLIRRTGQLTQLRLQLIKIDWLGDELGSAKLGGKTAAFFIAISGHHHDREIGESLLDLGQQLQAVHSWHVDVREDRDERGPDFPREPIQRLRARGGELHHIGSLTRLTAPAYPGSPGYGYQSRPLYSPGSLDSRSQENAGINPVRDRHVPSAGLRMVYRPSEIASGRAILDRGG